jgi:hypothetical protein
MIGVLAPCIKGRPWVQLPPFVLLFQQPAGDLPATARPLNRSFPDLLFFG